VGRAAFAAPGGADAAKGLALAKKGDCVRAVPLLEQAELTRHKPSTAYALAGCYVAEGDLLKAADMYHAVAGEKASRAWRRDDANAHAQAVKKAKEIDARIPTLRFEPDGDYEDIVVEIDGKVAKDTSTPRQMVADTKVSIVARAKGMKTLRDSFVLHEGERRAFVLRFEPLARKGGGVVAEGDKADDDKKDDADKDKPSEDPTKRPKWIALRYRGVILPKFIENIFVDGGREMFVPGVGVALGIPAGSVDVVTSLTYMNFSLSDTPFKGPSAPDTEWEIDRSTLQALLVEVDLTWSIPLDSAKDWNVRLGGGLGVGWAFAGELYRNQAYPVNGKPGDPYTYLKCQGPNNPRGTYRYCNSLDKDAKFYNGYADPSWFSGGLKPTIYPWAVVPEVGLSWRFTPRAAAELTTGFSLTGFLLSGGVKLYL
jgi:hypothetical protein